MCLPQYWYPFIFQKVNNFVQTSSIGCPLLDFGEVLQLQEFLWNFPTKNTQFTFPPFDALLVNPERGISKVFMCM